MAPFIALIKCIPAIVGILQELGHFVQKTFGDNPEKFLTDAHDAFRILNGAKTSEERVDAAKKLQGLLRRL